MVRFARRLMTQPAIQPYIAKELSPGPAVDSDEHERQMSEWREISAGAHTAL